MRSNSRECARPFLMLLVWFVGTGVPFSRASQISADCGQRVEMAAYALCFPKSWRVYRGNLDDRVSGCNRRSGPCTGTGGGYPLPGVVFVFISPAETVPGKHTYRSVRDIAGEFPQINEVGQIHPPSVINIPLAGSTPDLSRECLMSRSLIPGNVWNDVYGLRVGKRLFRCWAQYRNEPERIAEYRSEIVAILSSLSLKPGE